MARQSEAAIKELLSFPVHTALAPPEPLEMLESNLALGFDSVYNWFCRSQHRHSAHSGSWRGSCSRSSAPSRSNSRSSQLQALSANLLPSKLHPALPSSSNGSQSPALHRSPKHRHLQGTM